MFGWVTVTAEDLEICGLSFLSRHLPSMKWQEAKAKNIGLARSIWTKFGSPKRTNARRPHEATSYKHHNSDEFGCL
jgi:hypothetical protein